MPLPEITNVSRAESNAVTARRISSAMLEPIADVSEDFSILSYKDARPTAGGGGGAATAAPSAPSAPRSPREKMESEDEQSTDSTPSSSKASDRRKSIAPEIAGRENRLVFWSKLLVLFVLLASAGVVGYMTYFYVYSTEQHDFHAQVRNG